MASPSASPLALLATAPSKDAVVQLVDACYRHRADLSGLDAPTLAAQFGVDVPTVLQLAGAIRDVITPLVFNSASVTTPEQVMAVLPADLDARLKRFLVQIVAARLALWRDAAIRARVSLPALVDVDWRVDVKSSSAAISKIAVPTLLVNLKTRSRPTSTLAFPGEETLSVELSRGAYHSLVCGFARAPPRTRRPPPFLAVLWRCRPWAPPVVEGGWLTAPPCVWQKR